MDVLYHLTTEKGLQGILKDNKIKAIDPRSRFMNYENLKGENSVYFASSPEDCIALSPDCGADRFFKRYYGKHYERFQKFSESHKKIVDKYFKWVLIEKSYPVLEIPIAWIGEIHKHKIWGKYEYLCYHDVILKGVPNIIYVSTQPYYELVSK